MLLEEDAWWHWSASVFVPARVKHINIRNQSWCKCSQSLLWVYLVVYLSNFNFATILRALPGSCALPSCMWTFSMWFLRLDVRLCAEDYRTYHKWFYPLQSQSGGSPHSSPSHGAGCSMPMPIRSTSAGSTPTHTPQDCLAGVGGDVLEAFAQGASETSKTKRIWSRLYLHKVTL